MKMSPYPGGSLSLTGVYCVVVLMVMMSVLKLCEGESCTLSDIRDIQSDINFSLDKLDGRWYVSQTYGFGNVPFTSYTLDIVPTTIGLAVYSSSNTSAPGSCVYSAVELNATSETYTWTELNTTENPITAILAAADSNVQHGLIYLCQGHVVNPNDTCGSGRKAMLVGRQPTPDTADAWLRSLTSPLRCFTQDPDTIATVQQGQECPMKPIWKLHGRDCVVANFPVQENFNLTKYTEKAWLETAWLTSSPPSSLYQDYVHRYVPQENGSYVCDISARNPGQGCLYFQLLLTTTATPGKLILHDPAKGLAPYNVISTDYDHYALVFGCLNLTDAGECRAAHGWVWSRDAMLERRYLLATNSMIMDLCVNPAALFKTEHKNPCVKDTGGNDSLHIATILMGSMVLLVLVITV